MMSLLVVVPEHVDRGPGRERDVGHRLASRHRPQSEHQHEREQRRPRYGGSCAASTIEAAGGGHGVTLSPGDKPEPADPARAQAVRRRRVAGSVGACEGRTAIPVLRSRNGRGALTWRVDLRWAGRAGSPRRSAPGRPRSGRARGRGRGPASSPTPSRPRSRRGRQPPEQDLHVAHDADRSGLPARPTRAGQDCPVEDPTGMIWP